MTITKIEKQLKEWIRSHHLICVGTDFVFETIDQTQLDRFENCLEALGGHIRQIEAVGHWPMGPNRSLKILRAIASVPRPNAQMFVQYWANKGSPNTRFSEISD